MEVLYPRCAGLDVHKATVVAAVRLAAGGRVAREVRTFATTTAGLLGLVAWLAENGCTHVVMEATGVLGRASNTNGLNSRRVVAPGASWRPPRLIGGWTPTREGADDDRDHPARAGRRRAAARGGAVPGRGAARRMLALALVLEGSSREEAAGRPGWSGRPSSTGCTAQSPKVSPARVDRPRSGSKLRLTAGQEAELGPPWSGGRTRTGTAPTAGVGSTSKR